MRRDVTFEGGQTPFWRRMPKAGFSNAKFRMRLKDISAYKIQRAVEKGTINSSELITMKTLVDAKLVKGIKDGVKLIRGREDKPLVDIPLNIEVTRASKGAIEAVENAGGTVVTKWYNTLNLRALLRPQNFDKIPTHAKPPPKKMEYYTSDENRGYLSPLVQMRELKKKQQQQPN